MNKKFTFSLYILATCFSILLHSCSPTNHAVVSVADQEMTVVNRGVVVAKFPVSTSKYGVGDQPKSYKTPLGKMQVAKKIGDGAPLGAVFKSRKPTGEVLLPNAPGRDPIVTRILWLKGTEWNNQNAFSRYIYIHGTPEENKIGTPASYGCIRMTSKDVTRLYRLLSPGSGVRIIRESIFDDESLVAQY